MKRLAAFLLVSALCLVVACEEPDTENYYDDPVYDASIDGVAPPVLTNVDPAVAMDQTKLSRAAENRSYGGSDLDVNDETTPVDDTEPDDGGMTDEDTDTDTPAEPDDEAEM
ncbi:MAG: hypothetical protein ACLFVU_03050 [Phycisphaerae bacterium]